MKKTGGDLENGCQRLEQNDDHKYVRKIGSSDFCVAHRGGAEDAELEIDRVKTPRTQRNFLAYPNLAAFAPFREIF